MLLKPATRPLCVQFYQSRIYISVFFFRTNDFSQLFPFIVVFVFCYSLVSDCAFVTNFDPTNNFGFAYLRTHTFSK